MLDVYFFFGPYQFGFFLLFIRPRNTQGEYKQFPGMFPHAAGKIASNGPYDKVSDIYKIEGLTANDKKVFKMYQSEWTANPPGRMFDERINARVST